MDASKFAYMVFYSEDDEQYGGLCREFPGLSAFEDTAEEALTSIKDLVEYVITHPAEDDVIPQPSVVDYETSRFFFKSA